MRPMVYLSIMKVEGKKYSIANRRKNHAKFTYINRISPAFFKEAFINRLIHTGGKSMKKLPI